MLTLGYVSKTLSTWKIEQSPREKPIVYVCFLNDTNEAEVVTVTRDGVPRKPGKLFQSTCSMLQHITGVGRGEADFACASSQQQRSVGCDHCDELRYE
jgi:hypothetical protein